MPHSKFLSQVFQVRFECCKKTKFVLLIDLKNKDDLKNEDDLRNEDNLKNEDDHAPPPLKDIPEFFFMTSHRDSHTTTDVEPEMIPGI